MYLPNEIQMTRFTGDVEKLQQNHCELIQ